MAKAKDPRGRKPALNPKNESIAFRLDAAGVAALGAKASKMNLIGMSMSSVARLVLLQSLAKEGLLKLSE